MNHLIDFLLLLLLLLASNLTGEDEPYSRFKMKSNCFCDCCFKLISYHWVAVDFFFLS